MRQLYLKHGAHDNDLQREKKEEIEVKGRERTSIETSAFCRCCNTEIHFH